MQLDEVADDGEAEAGAARLARARLVHAVEALEDPRQLRLGDAVAGVGNGQAHPRAFGPGAEQDMAVFRRVGRGVLDEIAQHVVQLGRIAAHHAGVRRDGNRDVLTALLDARLQVGHDAAEQPLDRALGEFEGFLAGIEAGEAQEILHEAFHARGMPRDDLEELLCVGGLAGVVEQRFDVAANGGERRAQFVRDVGDEVAADAVGPAQVGDVVQHQHRAAAGRGDGRRAAGDEGLARIAAQGEFEPAGRLA